MLKTAMYKAEKSLQKKETVLKNCLFINFYISLNH